MIALLINFWVVFFNVFTAWGMLMNHLSARSVGETSVWRLPEVNDGGVGTSVRISRSPNISDVFVDEIILVEKSPKSKTGELSKFKPTSNSEKL